MLKKDKMVVESLDLQIEMTRICYNNDVIITILRHIENSGTVRTVYKGIFRHIQRHAAIFTHVQAY